MIRSELNLVGLAMRAERKVIDKIVDGLKFHSCDHVNFTIVVLKKRCRFPDEAKRIPG